ncbi:uncharacterized protein L969DRAFT_93159 [Mixia osmundae IAM 14324]|uniref:Chloride channel protein n=1 Tax=Mixia osmundae (strain CBS 9802 / IAM 14324 / JCM 22182 / KY 12970) TaxID=764103 RepID=G7E5X3_MIXOS|nr:uncharacterized protein L969DRAFT_93159 [Mixia osmundae IAM 14324]KEI40615.1 hypothetical protein L969DRAFT_93159 [Mixia osmundae IAM 14324]GAA98233.1 hypothetical protein E5Q_04916 [Mixia osmundae IAM 14324]
MASPESARSGRLSGRRFVGARTLTDEWDEDASEEEYEYLDERNRVAYSNFSTIDWAHEYDKERARKADIQAIPGPRGRLLLWQDIVTPWIVIFATGTSVGLLAAALDILSAWLAQLKLGVCGDDVWLDQVACCAGLEPGEICYSWKTWSNLFGLRSSVGQSLMAYTIYVTLAVGFATTSAFLVRVYAPYAFHSGIPEIKTILGGFIIHGYLAPWVLLIKSVGLSLSVASGLALGKEGPLVHVASCIGGIAASSFAVFRDNEARTREIISAASAAGVSVAFGAPLGGVLFSLEEVSSFFPGAVLWQSFVCAVIAAVTLQYSIGKLVLFPVTANLILRGFELVPFVFLGICGGLYGHAFIQLNSEYARFRRSSFLRHYPVFEVTGVAFVTAFISYLITFMRVPMSELVASLFQACSTADNLGLCDRDGELAVVFSLLVTAFVFTALTAVTFGMKLPAGLFMPTIAIGGCFGRALGILLAKWQREQAHLWIFSSCPADGACISPSVYAVLGSAAALAGVTRMTVSLVVIVMELTGAVSLVMQVMLCVLVSKFVGDFFSRDGIYEAWINLRHFPFLNTKIEYRDDTLLASDVMTGAGAITCLSDMSMSIIEVERLLNATRYRGFPVIDNDNAKTFLSYATREELGQALEHARTQLGATDDSICRLAMPMRGYSTIDDRDEGVDLRAWVEQTPFVMSPGMPMEVVIQVFQRMGLRHIIFVKHGRLAGMLTKHDVNHHLRIRNEGDSARLDLLRKRVKHMAPLRSGSPDAPSQNGHT